MTPLKAIRAHCLDCCCNQPQEVRLCVVESCALHPYRMGHNPARAGLGGFKSNGEPRETAESEDA